MYKDGDATGKPINKEPGGEYSRHFTSGRSPSSKTSPNVRRHKEMRGIKKPQPGSSSMDRKWASLGGEGSSKRMDNEVTKNAKFKRDTLRQQGRHMKWDSDRRKPEPGKKRPANERVTRNYELKSGGQNVSTQRAKKRKEGWVGGTMENRRRAVQIDRSKRIGRARESIRRQTLDLGKPKSNIRKFRKKNK